MTNIEKEEAQMQADRDFEKLATLKMHRTGLEAHQATILQLQIITHKVHQDKIDELASRISADSREIARLENG